MQRGAIIEAGKAQAATFDQARSAGQIADYCLAVVKKIRSGDIRLNTQALQDAFKDAERRRAAEARSDALEKALFDTKVELSSLSRLHQPVVSAASTAARAGAVPRRKAPSPHPKARRCSSRMRST